MTRYPALLDGERGAYGVSFPDLPGIVAMGETVDEAMVNAEGALRDYAAETEKTSGTIRPPTPIEQLKASGTVVLVPLIRASGRRVRTHLALDEGVAAFIDAEARRRQMTRAAFVEWMARRIAEQGG